MRARVVSSLASMAVLSAGSNAAWGVDYHLERITGVLNQPTYLTQAPGDPSNILYYSTRISTAVNGSGGAFNTMGKIWRYDVTTRASTAILDLSSRTITADLSLQAIAFHPDFNVQGSGGFGQMYVTSAAYGGAGLGPINRLEHFTILNPDGTPKAAADVLSSSGTILQYVSDPINWHTIDWIGFDPNASGAARNYLYVTTGDGRVSAAAQNPADVKGKVLRLDLAAGADAYPLDPMKNYGIPATNPLPVYNAANPGSPITGVGEVIATGLRNPHRASFDRITSDIYLGDVGEGVREEIDFLKAGSNTGLTPPVDFGWAQREGTQFGPLGPQSNTNTFTGVTSLGPVQQYPHNAANGFAVIAGYVYRGPIAELQGKYFYGDFVTGKVWMLDFDPNTPPATFDGNRGTKTEVTSLWNSLIVDPLNPGYVSDGINTTIGGIDHVVSFAEDNAGNLYLIDFSFGAGQGYFANGGEIFKLVPNVPEPATLGVLGVAVAGMLWQRRR